MGNYSPLGYVGANIALEFLSSLSRISLNKQHGALRFRVHSSDRRAMYFLLMKQEGYRQTQLIV